MEGNTDKVETKTENENNEKQDAKFVSIKVKGNDGSVAYKLKKHAKFSKLFDSYCTKCNIDKNLVRFLFDGERISADQTPGDLEMEDGDVIDVHMHQNAGSKHLD